MVKFLNKLWDLIVFVMDFVIRKLLHIPLSEKQWDALIQFVKFGIVGVSNTLIHYFTYLLLVALGCHYLIASVAGFLVSVTNAFYWNNKYVFTQEEGTARVWWQAFLKTFLSYAGTGLVLENILLVIWVQVLHVPKAVAPLVTLLITIPINFVLNKFWAFGDRENRDKKG